MKEEFSKRHVSPFPPQIPQRSFLTPDSKTWSQPTALEKQLDGSRKLLLLLVLIGILLYVLLFFRWVERYLCVEAGAWPGFFPEVRTSFQIPFKGLPSSLLPSPKYFFFMCFFLIFFYDESVMARLCCR